MRIQKHVYLAFEIRGKDLRPKNTNPILHQFYHMLNDIKFDLGEVMFVVTDKDRAIFETIDSTWVKGSIHLNMDILNYPGNMPLDIDHRHSSFLLRELGKLKVEEGETQINILEVSFSLSDHRFPQVWPKGETPFVVS